MRNSSAGQLYVQVVGSKSRVRQRSEWAFRRGFDLTAGHSVDTAVCVKKNTQGQKSAVCNSRHRGEIIT